MHTACHFAERHASGPTLAFGRKWPPAYDLTFSAGPGGEHTMAVAGEGRAPGRRHFADLARTMSITPAVLGALLEQVAAAVAQWPELAAETGVGAELIDEIGRGLSRVRESALRLA